MQWWNRVTGRVTLALALLAGVAGTAAAQGVTTGAVSGVVTEQETGQPIEGATVRITQTSTGFARTIQTPSNGRFIFQNLETGPGYTVSVTFIGFRPEATRDVRVNLSQSSRVDMALTRQAAQLEELVATAPVTQGEINPTRMGAQTVVSDSLVARLPSLNRQLSDFIKLSPQLAGNPSSSSTLFAAGQNNRFNNIQVDGTTQTDRFGLGSSGEIGGQSGGRGISLEAVKEYQVLISPYSVTQGNFTGALVNAVTKNGTNQYQGTAFFSYRSQDFAATPLRGTDFNVKQFGGSFGGPIIKDKLHFFVAGELNRSTRPATGPFLGQPAGTTPAVPASDADITSFQTILAGYGIDAGTAGVFNIDNPLTNLVGRIDWQISDATRMVVREIYNRAQLDDFSRTATSFRLGSNSFTRTEPASSSSIQLFTNFKSGASNEFQIGYTRSRFKRATPIIAPSITVAVPNAATGTGTINLVAGTENSSQGNELDQDLIEVRNDFSFPIRQRTQSHIITIGTRNEFYRVRNAFLQNSYGNWTFSNLANLQNGIANNYSVGLARAGQDPQARFWGATFAGYIQDQWTPTDNFNMTVGFRADLPTFFDAPPTNARVFQDVGRLTNDIPKMNPLFAPRIGFNWDVTRNQKNQIRGGIGMFAGPPVYVWLSNLFTNNGQGFSQLGCGPSAPAFNTAAVNSPPSVCANGSSLSNSPGIVNTVDPGLTNPQVLRASLAYDRELPWNIVGSVEGVFTRGINNLFYSNLYLTGPQGTGQGGRVLYGTLNPTTGAATPALIATGSPYGSAQAGGIFDLTNQGSDYSYNVTGSIRKRFSGSWEASAGYTYAKVRSVQDLTSSVAQSNWRFGRVYSGNQTDKTATTSSFEVPNRIVATVTYTAPWKKFPTDVSVIYSGQSGLPFTYIYFNGQNTSTLGDLNADGFNGNDPIYIPTNALDPTQIQFLATPTATAAQQAQAFQDFISSVPCLNKARGTIAQRNTCRNPWYNQLDVSLRQSLPQIAGQRLTLQADIYNFLNFLNRDWGAAKFAAASNLQPSINPQVNLLDHRGMAGAVPIVQFNPSLTSANQFANLTGAQNFWQAQFTIRYAF